MAGSKVILVYNGQFLRITNRKSLILLIYKIGTDLTMVELLVGSEVSDWCRKRQMSLHGDEQGMKRENGGAWLALFLL